MNKRYRHAIVAGNWKMNMLPSEIAAYADAMQAECVLPNRTRAIVCPPSVCIPAALAAFSGTKVSIGAQNMSEHESGAYTGEISGGQLADLGVQAVIIGHSERRIHYRETDETVSLKLRAALAAQLQPILCIGETLHERELGIASERIALQLKTALSGINAKQMREIIVAYEPVWAIGTGQTASSEEAGSACAGIRAILKDKYGSPVARNIPILYGGSLSIQNAAELFAMPDIDGGLVGGASLSPKLFAKIVMAAGQD